MSIVATDKNKARRASSRQRKALAKIARWKRRISAGKPKRGAARALRRHGMGRKAA